MYTVAWLIILFLIKNKLYLNLRKSSNTGVFHDSRADSKVLMKVSNILIDKVNELIDENAKLKKRIEDLEAKNNLL